MKRQIGRGPGRSARFSGLWLFPRTVAADHGRAIPPGMTTHDAPVTVLHIMGSHRVEPAHLTTGAVIRPDGTVVYPDAGDDATASGAIAPPNA